MAVTVTDSYSTRFSGMESCLLRRQVETLLKPDQVLRAVAGDRRPFALIGEWAGGGALIGSEPLLEVGEEQPETVWTALDDLPAIEAKPGTGAVGGGWFGYLGYQLGSQLERLPPSPARPLPLPSAGFAFYDHLLHWVEASGEWWFEALWTTDREAELERRYQILQRRLSQPAPELGRVELGHFTAQPSPAEHQAVIAEGIKHIRAGDVFQVNLCLRLEAAMQGDPLALFIPAVERLRPARAAYLALSQENHLLSFSPELFLQRQGREVLAAPIKGTLNGTLSSMELTHSGKDRAENVMIVDLMRNDLGRVCEAGSISVPTLVGLEAHLGVWHLVSQVRGRLKGGVSDAELLRATFPPGSVTGAPKIRAMELIAELESTGREIYTGAIGYISPLTGLELSVAIRSFEISGDRIWLGVGGGVVADSNPKAEFEECRVKAAPLLQAMGGRWQ